MTLPRRTGTAPGLEVQVYLWDLRAVWEELCTTRTDVRALLGPAELVRADRYRAPDAAADYIATHVAARAALAPLLGVPPAHVALGRLPCPACADPLHGPPGLPDHPDWRISLSRTRGHAALAVTSTAVGIDLERLRWLPLDVLTDVTLTPSERAGLLALPESLRLPRFYRAWTRKEAVLKAIGVGLAVDTDTVDVQPNSEHPVLVSYDHAGDLRHAGDQHAQWLVRDLQLGAGLTAALAQPAASSGSITLVRPKRVSAGLPRLAPVTAAGHRPPPPASAFARW